MTAMAKGFNMSSPVPMPRAAASDVMSTGRNRRLPARRICIGERHALAANVIDQVEHEDAVLGDDADRDDAAEERDDVQRRAGDGERRDAPEETQHGAEDDRDGLLEGPEVDDENREDQRDRRGQHAGEVLERPLLLRVRNSELDGGMRQRRVRCESLNVTHRAAGVAVLEPRGDGDVLAEILTA